MTELVIKLNQHQNIFYEIKQKTQNSLKNYN